MNRDLAIDALKGVLIIYIVAAHNNSLPEGIVRFCQPAIIGAFMLTSGYLTKDNFDLVRRLKGLIYPFLLFLLIGVVWQLGYGYLIHEHIDIRDWAMDMVLGRNLRFNIPLWFLISLAEINVMKKCLDRFRASRWTKVVIVAAAYFGGIYILTIGINWFYMSQSLIYLVFFCLGRLLRRHRYLLNGDAGQWTSLVIVSFILFVRVNFLDDVIDMGGLYVRYIGDSIIGVIIAYWIYQLLSKFRHKDVFCFFGKHSLVVMSLHIIVLDFIWRVWWKFFGEPDCLGGVIQTVIIILLLIPCCLGYKRYIEPHISPKKKNCR